MTWLLMLAIPVVGALVMGVICFLGWRRDKSHRDTETKRRIKWR